MIDQMDGQMTRKPDLTLRKTRDHDQNNHNSAWLNLAVLVLSTRNVFHLHDAYETLLESIIKNNI